MFGFLRGRGTALVAALACAAFIVICPGPARAGSYSIVSGDVLSISVYRQADLSLTVRVDTAGYVHFPIAGRILVAGKEVQDIEAMLTKALKRNGFASPEVIVSVETFAPRHFYVLGEVGTPTGFSGFSGVLPEIGDITAMQAIIAAGGLAASADLDHIVVRRAGAKPGSIDILPVPAREVLTGRNAQDVVLRPLDMVVVPKAKPVLVIGAANKTGEFYSSPELPLTVSRLMALIGGTNRPKSMSRLRIIRGKQTMEVDIQTMLEENAGSADPLLEPGDIVYVPEIRW